MSGALALRLDEATLANTRFAAAIATGGNNPEVPIQIAMAYMEAEQFKSAFDVLSRVAGVHDRDARFPYYMGVACIQMKQDSASIVLFRHAIRLDPSFTDAWVQLGLGFEALQMTDSADAAYTAVLSLDPDQHLVNNNFAYSLAVRGKDMQRARSMAWRAVQQYPSNAAYLDTYAWVLYRMGQYDEAKVYIEKAITRGGNATHYEHYGDILEALGMLDAAVDAWDRALTLDPSREAVKAKVFKFR
jgi:tetratricopeptide (TPR) repeat protein